MHIGEPGSPKEPKEDLVQAGASQATPDAASGAYEWVQHHKESTEGRIAPRRGPQNTYAIDLSSITAKRMHCWLAGCQADHKEKRINASGQQEQDCPPRGAQAFYRTIINKWCRGAKLQGSRDGGGIFPDFILVKNSNRWDAGERLLDPAATSIASEVYVCTFMWICVVESGTASCTQCWTNQLA